MKSHLIKTMLPLLLLAGCASNTSQTTTATDGQTSAESVELSIWHTFTEHQEDLIESLADEYEAEHPNVTINVIGGYDPNTFNATVQDAVVLHEPEEKGGGDSFVTVNEGVVLNDKVKKHRSLLFNAGVEVSAFPGLIDLADAAVERCVFLHAEQFACSELFLQTLDGFDSIFVGGVEALRSSRVCNFEALVIVSIQRIKGVGVVSNYVEQIGRLVGCEEQFFAKDVLQQAHSFLEVFVFLLGYGIVINYVSTAHILLDDRS